MVDQETQSLWSHLLGSCMQGPLVGQQLEVIPSVITDWETWHMRHPDTTLAWLPRSTDIYRREQFGPDSGLVIGLSNSHGSRFWSLADLDRNPVINDRFGENEIVVVYDRTSRAASIFSRRLGDRILTFTLGDGVAIDEETASQWDTITGNATGGSLKGQVLTRLPGIISDAAAWNIYHADTTFWRAKDR